MAQVFAQQYLPRMKAGQPPDASGWFADDSRPAPRL